MLSVDEILPLDQLKTIVIDENGIWHRPEYPRYKEDLAAPRPVLVPSLDNKTVEVTPTEKEDQKIRFSQDVEVMEIENRFQMMDPEEWEDDDDYEIEIVEGSGAGGDDDADFYLEMIDGEIFYVFETEDDISLDEDASSDEESESVTQNTEASGPVVPLQLDFTAMMAQETAMGNSFADLDIDVSAAESVTENEELIEVSNDQSGDMSVVDDKEEDNDAGSASGRKPTTISEADVPPVSPVRQSSLVLDLSAVEERPCSPLPDSPVRSILKSAPLSPASTVKSGKREKREKAKKEKKEKTFTKTFVRAADFDGEHRVYNWEKPTWTNQQLKSTGKGDDIRSGKNLANPITNASKLIEKGQVKWEKPEWADGESEHDGEDLNAKEELIKRIQEGQMNLPGLRRNKSRLKLSINGSILAEGGDIVKPITKATIIQKPNINYVANPKILRATPVGSRLKSGERLEAPVTKAASHGKYNWEKPSWVTKKLHSTEEGEKLKAGHVPVSSVKSKIEWEKPDWTKKRGIGRGASSESLEGKKEYLWEKPSWATAKGDTTALASLRQTPEGKILASGENDLARPITNLPHVTRDDNDVRSKGSRPPSVQRSKSTD